MMNNHDNPTPDTITPYRLTPDDTWCLWANAAPAVETWATITREHVEHHDPVDSAGLDDVRTWSAHLHVGDRYIDLDHEIILAAMHRIAQDGGDLGEHIRGADPRRVAAVLSGLDERMAIGALCQLDLADCDAIVRLAALAPPLDSFRTGSRGSETRP